LFLPWEYKERQQPKIASAILALVSGFVLAFTLYHQKDNFGSSGGGTGGIRLDFVVISVLYSIPACIISNVAGGEEGIGPLLHNKGAVQASFSFYQESFQKTLSIHSQNATQPVL